jgi:hypothetical protein
MTDSSDSELGPSDTAESTGANQDAQGAGAPNAHPLEPLIKHLAELREFALHYGEARKDQAKASAKHFIMLAGLVCVVGVSGIALVTTSAILVLTGLAEVVGEALGDRAGLGRLVVGGGTLMACIGMIWIALSRRNWNARQQTKQKYERRHHAQRVRFGEDVAQRASS